MNVRHRLKNKLVRKIQQLSSDKLSEVERLLNKIEENTKSKEFTLKMAGRWREMDSDLFDELTLNLHFNRGNDRQIG